MSTIAVIDIGNTSTTVALAQGGRVGHALHADSGSWRAEQAIQRELRRLSRSRPLDGAVIASVVPDLSYRWMREITDHIGVKPLLVNHHLALGVQLRYPGAHSLGADRLANLSGALMRYRPPMIVADFGTAATFDVVNRRSEFIGGVIAPGPAMMAEGLHEHTSLLPRIALAGPLPRVGRSTAGAMQIGVRVGYRGLVRETVEYLRRIRGLADARLVVTGGYATRAMSGVRIPFTLDRKLTLEGLARIYDLNAGGQ